MQLTCRTCKLLKDESEFYYHDYNRARKERCVRGSERNYRRLDCNKCCNAKSRASHLARMADPEKAKVSLEKKSINYKTNITRYWEQRQASRAKKLGSSGRVTWEEWQEIQKQHDNKCHWCGMDLHPSYLTVDHVIPFCQGGKHLKENVVPACMNCNHKRNWEHKVKYPELYGFENL